MSADDKLTPADKCEVWDRLRAAPEFEGWLGTMDLVAPDGSIRALADGAMGLVHRLGNADIAA